MIRTIWLGFTFLIVLAGVGSFRFAFGHFDAANASGIVRSEIDRTVGRGRQLLRHLLEREFTRQVAERDGEREPLALPPERSRKIVARSAQREG